MKARFMDEDECIQIIVRLCVDGDGFLVKLHSFSDFDTQKYGELVQALNLYLKHIENKPVINRQVAGCILALHDEFMVQLSKENTNPFVHIAQQRVEKAFNEVELLIQHLLRV